MRSCRQDRRPVALYVEQALELRRLGLVAAGCDPHLHLCSLSCLNPESRAKNHGCFRLRLAGDIHPLDKMCVFLSFFRTVR